VERKITGEVADNAMSVRKNIRFYKATRLRPLVLYMSSVKGNKSES